MNKLFSFVCVITLLLISAKGIADSKNLHWISDYQSKLRKRINLDDLSFEAEIRTNEWVKLGQVMIQPDELAELVRKFNNADPLPRPNQIIRFVVQGTGLIYDFHEKQKKLTRIDKTIHSGHNFNSHRFYRDNILYSIGGEGFWSYNKRITYFDEQNSKEWEILRPKNEGPEVISDGYQGYSKQADVFFSGGSTKKNFLENEEINQTPTLFKFDFKLKMWIKLGEINFPHSMNAQKIIFWNGTHFVQLERDKVYFLNPEENTIHVYSDNTTYFEDAGYHYISQDTVIYYSAQNNGNLRLIPVNSLLKKSKFVGRFYSESTSTNTYLLILAFLFLGVFILILIRKKRKKSIKLDDLEHKLLAHLLQSKGQIISTIDLNELLDCSTKSQENQRRIRYLILNQINQKIENHFNINNAIERTPSEEDKRIFNYHLKPGIEGIIEKAVKLHKN